MNYRECLNFKEDIAVHLEKMVNKHATESVEEKDFSYKLIRGMNYVVYNFSHGDKFVGRLLNNKFCGEGAYYFSDGSVRVGTWKNNNLFGKAILFNADGTCQKEEWEDDQTCIYSSERMSVKKLAKELKKEKGLER